MELIYTDPEETFLDYSAAELKAAQDDIFFNSGEDIDNIADLSDEDLEDSDYDPEDDDCYNGCYYDDNTIEYEIETNDDEDEDDDDYDEDEEEDDDDDDEDEEEDDD